MSYTETKHAHQSDTLTFLPKDYIPYQKLDGAIRYGVITLQESILSVVYQITLPTFGGYIARESIYGSPSYCANATRNHKQHFALYGSMPHLVFFGTQEAAEAAGFRACKRCL